MTTNSWYRMLIEISIGEGLDRLSILEIKEREITNTERLVEVRKEILSLHALLPYREQYRYYYNLILLVNKRIWDLTNEIKAMTSRDATFAEMAHEIFELNQSRFRVKNILNQMSSDGLKEQKSYAPSRICVTLSSDTERDELRRQLAYLSVSYDQVQLLCDEVLQQYIHTTIPPFNYIFSREGCGVQLTEIHIPSWFMI
jgi:hypothetical protein